MLTYRRRRRGRSIHRPDNPTPPLRLLLCLLRERRLFGESWRRAWRWRRIGRGWRRGWHRCATACETAEAVDPAVCHDVEGANLVCSFM